MSETRKILVLGANNEFQKQITPLLTTIDSSQDNELVLKTDISELKNNEIFNLAFIDATKQNAVFNLKTIQKIWNQSPETGVIVGINSAHTNFEKIIDELGITDNLFFLTFPFDQTCLRQAIVSMFTKWDNSQSIKKYIQELETTISRRTTQLNESVNQLQISNHQLDKSMSELKESQQLMNENNKFTALGEMAGGIAHEINTPLAIIKLVAGQIQELLNEESINKAQLNKLAKNLDKTADRIAAIIRGLRAFSRNAGNDPIKPELVSKIIEDTLVLCESAAKNNSIQISISDIPKNLSVLCRAVQISQVLLNLLNNARDAVENLGEKWVRIDVTELPQSVKISVTDSGSGIAEEVRKKLFQPFFTTKPVGRGTGLGLSVSKGIIESHLGKIGFDTGCKNTRIVIELPKPNSNTTGETT